jgi:hypothetical protein
VGEEIEGAADDVALGVVLELADLDGEAVAGAVVDLGEQLVPQRGAGHLDAAPQPLGAVLPLQQAGHRLGLHAVAGVPVHADHLRVGLQGPRERAAHLQAPAEVGAAGLVPGHQDALADPVVGGVGGSGGTQQGAAGEQGQ